MAESPSNRLQLIKNPSNSIFFDPIFMQRSFFIMRKGRGLGNPTFAAIWVLLRLFFMILAEEDPSQQLRNC
ncbi:MAG: hypothetical protein GY822_01270 [Deltaproteobacteria bacterium]|nr:hypothetical protein [Deltaproteobacteria bacterium]